MVGEVEEYDVDKICDQHQQYEGREEAYQSDTLKVLGLTRYREDSICSGARIEDAKRGRVWIVCFKCKYRR